MDIPSAARPRRSPPRALLAALRPRQWTKNLFVYAAIVLTQQLTDLDQLFAATFTFVLFCAVSSSVYLFNDLADIESDRLHPEKRHRPLAAGELSPRVATVMAVILAAGGLLGSIWLLLQRPCDPALGPIQACTSPILVGAVLAYLLLQLAYTFWLKHYVIIEVLAIAGGFLLRVLAGGAAINTAISPYLYLSMLFLALFQGFAKRHHEIQVLADAAGGHRKSLEEYTTRLLDYYIIIAAASTLVTYSLYAITTPDRPAGVSANVLLLTVPFVIYAIFRYLYLVQVRGIGGAPEEILLRDKLLLADVIGWALSLLLILYVVPWWAAR